MCRRVDADRIAGAVLGADGDGEGIRPQKLRRFLRFELDAYPRPWRRGDRGAPLYRVETQEYIHYRKGSWCSTACATRSAKTRSTARSSASCRTRATSRRRTPPAANCSSICAPNAQDKQALITTVRKDVLYDNRVTEASAKSARTASGLTLKLHWQAGSGRQGQGTPRRLRRTGESASSPVPRAPGGDKKCCTWKNACCAAATRS